MRKRLVSQSNKRRRRDGMPYTSGLQKILTLVIARRNPTALGPPAHSPKLGRQKRTRELGGAVPCERISPVLPVPGRIREEQAIV